MIGKRRAPVTAAIILTSFALALAALYVKSETDRHDLRQRWPLDWPARADGTSGAPRLAKIPDEDVSYNDSRSLDLEQKQRQRRLSQACTRYSGLWQNSRSWAYEVDERRGTVFCPIPRAGWRSWRQVMLDATGASNATAAEAGLIWNNDAGIQDMALTDVIRLKKSRPQSKSLFTFAFVRNPWKRLISAYISKAVDSNYTRIMHSPCSWETAEPYRKSITFVQFLRCILEQKNSTTTMDAHWSPMWMLCDFCRLRYDFVGHLETAAADAAYVVTKRNFSTTYPRVFFSRTYRTDDVVREWYRAVPRQIIDELRSVYKFDFLLHGYRDAPPSS